MENFKLATFSKTHNHPEQDIMLKSIEYETEKNSKREHSAKEHHEEWNFQHSCVKRKTKVMLYNKKEGRTVSQRKCGIFSYTYDFLK